MSATRLKYLLERHFNKSCSPEEKEELATMLLQAEQDEALKELLEKMWMNYAPDEQLPEATAGHFYHNIMERADRPAGRRLPLLHARWLRYAAAVVLLFGLAAYFWPRPQKFVETGAAPAPADIAPGGTGAVLTLADGTEMVLDSLGNGVVATQNGARVTLQNGQLSYQSTGAAMAVTAYNTMATPKGRQFRLILPDGSRVWLNAASRITFPTVFTGRERKVAISGEAYFEVAKNPGMPFKVQMNASTTVEVLGTHFNINSYADEPGILTTLLEGSVKVTAGTKETILTPGQQAQVKAAAGGQHQLQVNNADINKIMAWKNGYFQFSGMDLPAVMREISRWYDVEISYKGRIPEKEFAGEIPRSITLRNLLQLIEFGDVQLEISGNHVTVIGQ